MNWSVELTEAERRICTWVGKQRHASAVGNNRNPGHGASGDDPLAADNHIRGALCEYAASLILNLSWRPSIGIIRDRDVGGLIEVRSTVLSDGRIVVEPDKLKTGAPYVLISFMPDEPFQLVGWIFGEQIAAVPLTTYPRRDPAHYVPRSALRPNDELIAWIRNNAPPPAA